MLLILLVKRYFFFPYTVLADVNRDTRDNSGEWVRGVSPVISYAYGWIRVNSRTFTRSLTTKKNRAYAQT